MFATYDTLDIIGMDKDDMSIILISLMVIVFDQSHSLLYSIRVLLSFYLTSVIVTITPSQIVDIAR